MQLYRGRPGNVPIIELNSGGNITLSFDELADAGNTFRIRFTHHNADWSESGLISNFFLSGFQDDTISGGVPGIGQHPSFFTYSYTFPNRDIRFRASGNYMLHVSDYVSGEKLFSLPFFISEDTGGLSASTVEYFSFGNFPFHQVFTEYAFPEFIRMPQADLTVMLVQNRFWSRYIEASVPDVSTPGVFRAHNPRDDGFFGRYEFRPLLIDDIYSISRDVIEVQPDRTPPLVRLQYDVVDMDVNPRPSRSFRFGQPLPGRNARYTEVEFNLERPNWFHNDADVYVYGSFNNWQIANEGKMEYLPESDSYRATVLIKEGRYDYKYAVIENNTVDDLRLDAFFADSRQEYQVLVYFTDPQNLYDRLLQTGTLNSR